MQEWIRLTYEKNIPSTTVERKLHQANYSWKSSRPSPYKGDIVKQEEFKKMELRKWCKT